jgi:hypothetical protein
MLQYLEYDMKAILEFDLPEDETEHRCAINGVNWMSALFRIDENLRQISKHGDDDQRAEFADEIRDMIREEMDTYKLTWEV